jgi:hypothetical protein
MALGVLGKISIGYGGTEVTDYRTQKPQGRWPANVILDEVSAGLLDEQSGVSKSGNVFTRTGFKS